MTLGLDNNYNISRQEAVEGGYYVLDVVLMNPYTSLPHDE
jgi:hypothetical protein